TPTRFRRSTFPGNAHRQAEKFMKDTHLRRKTPSLGARVSAYRRSVPLRDWLHPWRRLNVAIREVHRKGRSETELVLRLSFPLKPERITGFTDVISAAPKVKGSTVTADSGLRRWLHCEITHSH